MLHLVGGAGERSKQSEERRGKCWWGAGGGGGDAKRKAKREEESWKRVERQKEEEEREPLRLQSNSLSPGVESQLGAFPSLVATLGGWRWCRGPRPTEQTPKGRQRKEPAAHFADPFPTSPTVPHLFLLRSHRPTGKPHWKGPPLLAGGSGCWVEMLSPSSAPARIFISLPSEGAAHCRDPLLV